MADQELFRMKIAAKRQMTVPQRLLDVLSLTEGDEIHLTVQNKRIVEAEPCKTVPIAMLSTALMEKLRERERKMIKGQVLTEDEAMDQIKLPV